MPGHKWFTRRPVSPVTPTMASPVLGKYPLPPFMSPSKGNMTPRDDTAASRKPCLEVEEEDNCNLAEVATPVVDRHPQQQSPTPSLVASRRDSAIAMRDAGVTERQGSILNEDEPAAINIQSSPPVQASTWSPSITISHPDYSWHSAPASWLTMDFAQQNKLQQLYVIGLEEVEKGTPLSQFQVGRDATSRRVVPFTGQLLAAYGLDTMSAPWQLPWQYSLLEGGRTQDWQERAESGEGLLGQTYTFYRQIRAGDDHVYFAQKTSPSPTMFDRIILTAFRDARHGDRLCEADAKALVDVLVDIYASNGSKYLFRGPRCPAAQRLRGFVQRRPNISARTADADDPFL